VQALSFDVVKVRQFIQLQAIWGSVTNDRQKRAMVEAAINWVGRAEHRRMPRLADDAIWAVKRGNTLEEQCNNVLHSPLYQNRNALVEAMLKLEPGAIIPSTDMMNFRARKLSAATVEQQRSLLSETRHYRNGMYAVAEFLRQINDTWQGRLMKWPERPSLTRFGKKSLGA